MDELLAMIEHPNTQAVVEASLVQFDHPAKTRYLSFRACGFTISEAQKFSQISSRTRFRWRSEDADFSLADDHIGSVQKEVANKYISMEFRRNLRLVLELDFRVLAKVATNPDEVLSPRELGWLNKLRQHYTPQQLEAMASALGESEGNGGFDFAKFVLGLARGSDKLVIAGSRE